MRWQAIAPHHSDRSDPLLFLDPSGFVKHEFASNRFTNHDGEKYTFRLNVKGMHSGGERTGMG